MSDPHVPASAPVESEPQTPMWLPALGAALFIAVALWWAVTPSAQPAAEAAAPSPSSSSAAQAAPQPAPQPPGSVAIARPAQPPSAPAPANPAEFEERLKQLRQHMGAQPGNGH